MEVENYHTLYVDDSNDNNIHEDSDEMDNSLEQGTLSWKNVQYQWEGEERFTDMSQDESLI